MESSYVMGFTTDEPDEFLWSVEARVCARLESEEASWLGSDLSPDDYTVERLTFERQGDYAEVEVEVTHG